MTERQELKQIITEAPTEDIKTAAAFFKAVNWIKANPGKAPAAEIIAAEVFKRLEEQTIKRAELIRKTNEITKAIEAA